MDADPKDPSAGAVSPESLRREVDRQLVGLLRRNHEDNRQIIALLSQVVDLLREPRAAAPSSADTGFYSAIN
jgi:hypothetical protein